MVLAYHLILCCYGFWLPNDPRGSWSEEVRRYELLRFGPASKVNTRRSVARIEHDYRLRESAKVALKHRPVVLDGRQALAVARGFETAVDERGYRMFACAVMPEHVHLVIGRHTRTIELIGRHLKARATQRLNADGLGFERSPWSDGRWKVFLSSSMEIRRAIRYVARNPIRDGLKRQRWPFVIPYLV